MITPEVYKQAMGRFASGVTVVVLDDGAGGIMGLTVSAFSSVSLAPPLVLICVDRSSECFEALAERGRFTVHVLAEDQTALAYRFADGSLDKSDHADWRMNERGYPELLDALAWMECRLVARHGAGDHDIFVGEVEGLRVAEGKGPLLYYQGKVGGPAIFS
jgi:flavin reductase (DIM6/NTAB) family NADH-FMN oxidoreductase RutF